MGVGGSLDQSSSVSAQRSAFWSLAQPGTLTNGLYNEERVLRGYVHSSANVIMVQRTREYLDSGAAGVLTTFNLYGAIDVASGSEKWSARGDQGGLNLYAECPFI